MSLADPDDRRLAAAVVAAGDEAAFRALYRRHTPALYCLARRLGGGDESWAEELVQRAWIRAVESLDGFAWRSAFRTWLSGIAINCAREQWRAARASPEVQASQDAAALEGFGFVLVEPFFVVDNSLEPRAAGGEEHVKGPPVVGEDEIRLLGPQQAAEPAGRRPAERPS